MNEVFARTFEVFVRDLLDDFGIQNTWLVPKKHLLPKWAYPTPDEMVKAKIYIVKLLKTL